MLESSTREVYRGASFDNLSQLRNEAAKWALDRELVNSEEVRIRRALESLSIPSEPSRIIRLQEDPLLTIRLNRSGLTREQVGPAGVKVACLFYMWDQMHSGGAGVTLNMFTYKGMPRILDLPLN